MKRELLLTAAILSTITAGVSAEDITLKDNHTVDSNYNLVSTVGNVKVDPIVPKNENTVHNVILGGWSKYTGTNIYNIFSGTEVAPSGRNVENIAIGDVVKIKDSDYGLMIGNHITNENDEESIKKYGRRSTMIKGDYITVKNSPHATVLGQDNTVTNSYGAFVHGKDAVAENATWSVVMGQNASAKMTTPQKGGSVVIGQGANTNSNFTIAMGASAAAKNYAATAIGGLSEATGKYSLAMAQGTANGEGAVAIGMDSVADKKASVSLGVAAKSMADRAVAIGYSAGATADETIAMGTNSKASGVSSISIGRDNNVSSDDTVVVGANNGTVAAGQTAVFGYNNVVQGTEKEQLIFGVNSTTKEQGATVVGSHAQATAIDAVALGNNTVVDVQNGVAIGTNSTTDNAVGTSTIKDNTTDIRFMNSSYAGENPDSVVSFGANGKAGKSGVTKYTRQLQNVAAGRVSSTSTDAINGSQLYDVALEAQKYNTVVDGTNTTVDSTDNAFGRKEYKVNVNKDLNGMNSVNFGSNTDSVRGTVSKNGAQFFNGSVNTNVTTNGIQIEDTDSLEQANFTKQGMYASEGNKTVYFTTNGVSAGDQIINGVKAGVAGTDAVNVDQLNKAIKDNRTVVEAGDNIVVKEDAGTYTVSTAKDLTNLNSVSLNDGNNESTYTTEGINMTYRGADDEYHTSYKYDGVHITTNDGDANPVNEVSLTDKGLNNGGNRITKVGKGIDGDDGVNVNQLRDELAKNKAVESVIADNQVDNIAAVRVTNGKSTGDANAQYGVYVSRSTVDAIAKASNRFAGDDVINVTRWNGPANVADLTTFKYNGEKAATKTPLTYKANGKDAKQVMLADGLDFTNGKNTTATTDANGVVKYSVNDNLNGMKSVNFDGGTTVNNDGLTINNGPSVTKDGIDAGNKTITNVAPGRVEAGSTDAINGSQLNDAAQRISNRYDAAIANNQREISKVGARAAAMANLHYQDFNADDKWSFAAGYGHYKGQNAGAIGVAYQPNENTMITASTTIGKDAMYGAGVSMKFGKSSKMNANKQVAMAKEIEELRAIVAAQNAKIDALVDHAMGRNEAITDVVFPDVPENHWAYMMVQDLAYKGIVVGYPDGNYQGNRTLTRYEFAVALDRAISAGYMSPELGRAIKEFKVELDQVQNGMRFRVDRVSGRDGATDKVERVRVNKDNTRDNYGTIVR
jgi:hemagglutinin family protein